jgi:DNA-binding beta-propeller fold protein YncE
VADGYRNSRVHRFSADGQLKKSWGEPGKGGPNEFHLPHSILVDGDNVVVCDRENDRIQVFGLDGDFKEIWDDIQRPMDISMDSDGNYMVSEGQRENSARISILDKKGGVLSRFDCRGSGHGSWIDSRGDIYLAGVPDAIDKYVRKG